TSFTSIKNTRFGMKTTTVQCCVRSHVGKCAKSKVNRSRKGSVVQHLYSGRSRHAPWTPARLARRVGQQPLGRQTIKCGGCCRKWVRAGELAPKLSRSAKSTCS